MTEGQQESIYLIYVNVCNALIYADDILVDNSMSASAKSAIRVIRDRLSWIKKNMDLKAEQDVSKTVDTLRYDGVLRLLASMPEENQGELEDLIVNYLKSIENV
jgi:flagellin-specific chaperone FliS